MPLAVTSYGQQSRQSAFQYISPGAPAVEPCTYWPTVHAVAGEATTAAAVAPAALAGGVDPAGVHVPGMPAVAPVAVADGTTAESPVTPHSICGFPVQRQS